MPWVPPLLRAVLGFVNKEEVCRVAVEAIWFQLTCPKVSFSKNLLACKYDVVRDDRCHIMTKTWCCVRSLTRYRHSLHISLKVSGTSAAGGRKTWPSNLGGACKCSKPALRASSSQHREKQSAHCQGRGTSRYFRTFEEPCQGMMQGSQRVLRKHLNGNLREMLAVTDSV